MAFGRAESGGKLKKGGFAKVEILRKYQVIEEVPFFLTPASKKTILFLSFFLSFFLSEGDLL